MARRISRRIQLPTPPTRQEDVLRWLRESLLPALQGNFDTHLHITPDSLEGELRSKEYTEATKPGADVAGKGAVIISTDAATKPQMSDGTSWIMLGGGAAGPTGPAGTIGPPGIDYGDPTCDGADALMAAWRGYGVPSGYFATASSEGSASTVLRSDAVFKWPSTLMDTGALHTLALTDSAGAAKLTGSDGFLRMETPTGFSMQATGVLTGGAVIGVNIDPANNNGGIFSATTAAQPVTTNFCAWKGNLSLSGAAVTNNLLIAPFLCETWTWTTSLGSTATGLQGYGAIFRGPLLSTANGSSFTDMGGLWVRQTKGGGAPTCPTGYGGRFDMPVVGSTDQIGLSLIDPGGLTTTPTNRYGLKVNDLIRGTNQWAIYTANRAHFESVAARQQTVLDLLQLATGNVAGAHINMDDKAGDPPAPNSGDVWRSGNSLWFKGSTAPPVDLAAAQTFPILQSAADEIDPDTNTFIAAAPTPSSIGAFARHFMLMGAGA